MSEHVLQVRIDLGLQADAEGAELDEAARALGEELLALDVHDVTRVTDGAPASGARGVDAVLPAALLVFASKEAISAVVRSAEQWLRRRPARSVKVTIEGETVELSDASEEQQRELVEAFLQRHGAPQA